MAYKPNATVCGVPEVLGGPIHYNSTSPKPGVGTNGHYRAISRPGAKRVVKALFGHERLPRPGFERKLCENQYLVNNLGSLDIVRRGPGDIRGARRRKRSRR